MQWSATEVIVYHAYATILSTEALLICTAVDVHGTSGQQPKASLAVSDKISGQRKRDKQGPAKKHIGDLSK